MYSVLWEVVLDFPESSLRHLLRFLIVIFINSECVHEVFLIRDRFHVYDLTINTSVILSHFSPYP